MMKCSLKEHDVLLILFIHLCIVVAVQDMGLHMLKCVMSHGKTFAHKLEHVETLKIGTNHRCFITSILPVRFTFLLEIVDKTRSTVTILRHSPFEYEFSFCSIIFLMAFCHWKQTLTCY